ncbi:MAG: hypothetical protein WC477_04155 [Patescibacteria group bacterium]
MSLAYAQLMQANATLEDALIGELENQKPTETYAIWERSRDQFVEMAKCLGRLVEAFTASINDMDGKPFLHGAILQSTNLDQLKSNLVITGAVNTGDQLFDTVGHVLQNGGFEAIFRLLKSRAVQHQQAAESLVSVYKAGEEYAKAGTLLRMIEANELPFRLRFAQLMNPFTETLQMFSYSSLISIEVHYRSTHCQPGTSLLQKTHAMHA